MSVERSFEAWEEVQRHGQDLADRLAQGFSGLIQSHITPPSFPWPNTQKPKLFDVEFPTQGFGKRDFGIATDSSGISGVSAIFDIGNRLGQAGADFGACLDGVVQQFFRMLPVPFRQDENVVASLRTELNSQRTDVGLAMQENLGSLADQFRGSGCAENEITSDDGSIDDEMSSFNLKLAGLFGRSQVIYGA